MERLEKVGMCPALVLYVSSKGAQAVRFLYNPLQFIAAEQNPVWIKTWCLYDSLPPPFYQKKGKLKIDCSR